MTEVIEMPFGMWTLGPKEPCTRWSLDPTHRKGEFGACPCLPTVDVKKVDKGSPYSITDRRVRELIPVLGSQPEGDVNRKPDGRLRLLFARPAVTPATHKRAATNFAAW